MVSHGELKRARLDGDSNSAPAQSFTSGAEVREIFRAKQPAALEVLKTLRNQITVKFTEQSVAVNDTRLNIVREWLEAAPGAQDVFGVLEKGPQPAVIAVCLSILSSLISITSYHLMHQSLGQTIIQKLLTPQWLRKLDGYMFSSNPDVCLAAMKLLNFTSNFAGGKGQKELLEAFTWDVKVFHKLLYMRRKGKDASDMLAKPDIRTLSMQYILSFLSASSSVKTMFIEQHRDVVLSIFKGISSDPYSVIRYVLETLWANLWQDQKVKRTLKVGIFGETTLQHLLKIYERSEQEGTSHEHVPADVVHHFLLAICTHRGVGICFADDGWFPRKETSNDSSAKRGGKIYNKILANVLKMLKVNEDARQQELALKILNACPELVTGYLPSSGLTLEPRLSSKWLANMAFVGSVVSIPVPVESFYLPVGVAGSSSASAQCAYQPTPPPLATIMENILPSLSLKMQLSKALQSNFALVQQVAGLTLAQCLRKCEEVFNTFLLVERALEEDEAEGQWSRRRIEIEREMRKRVPEFQVIVAFSNAHRVDGASGNGPSRLRSALLCELGHRLLWLYHRCVPSLVAEARYDVGKSLQGFVETDQGGPSNIGGIDGLRRLQQLHVLRMLRESDQFVWNAKAAPSASSNINILLKLYLHSNHADIRTALTSLLSNALKESLLFQHDPEELHLWLDALPWSLRSLDAESPDEVQLTDEGTSVIAFLDECMQRCAKTTHRYFEELEGLVKSFESSGRVLPGSRLADASPLLMTVLEQLNAKIRNNLLSPSDVLALTTYLRRVIVGLLGKQSDLVLCQTIVERITSIVSGEDALLQHPVMSNAVRKEIGILNASLYCCTSQSRAAKLAPQNSPNVVEIFISQAESYEIETGNSAKFHAFELVDWFRLVDQPMDRMIVVRLARVVYHLYPRALSLLCLHLDPQSDLLWSLLAEKWQQPIERRLPVDWLILHAPSDHSPAHVSLLKRSLRQRDISVYDWKRFCGLILHRLDPQCDLTSAGHTLELLAALLESAKVQLSSGDLSTLKVFIFVDRPKLRSLSCVGCLPFSTSSALQRLLDLVLNKDESDRALVGSISRHWVSTLSATLSKEEWEYVTCSLKWIKYMSYEDLLGLTDKALVYLQSQSDGDSILDTRFLDLMEELLLSLLSPGSQAVKDWLNQRLATLIGLLLRMPASAALRNVICRCVDAGTPIGTSGLPASDNHGTLRSAVASARSHWQSRLCALPAEISVDALAQSTFSKDTVNAVASLIYRSPNFQKQFCAWLTSIDLSKRFTLEVLIPALHAYFDSRQGDEVFTGNELHVNLFSQIAGLAFEVADLTCSKEYQVECLMQLLRCCPSQRTVFINLLKDRVSKLSVDTLCTGALRLVFAIENALDVTTESFIEATAVHSLQWAVRYLSELPEDSTVDEILLGNLTKLISLREGVAPHYAEPVISACIRHHLKDTTAVRLAEELLSKVSLKPMNVNRHLQGVLQHAQFESLCGTGTASKPKDAVISMLYALFHLHPNNTCQPSHIRPLICLYGGSLSDADCQLLAIFRLFEEHRKISTSSIFEQWGSAGVAPQSSRDAATNLDANRVFRTCLSFPIERDALPYSKGRPPSRREDREIYDPLFVLLLFSQVLAVDPPATALSWVSLYRTNIVSFVIRCLSSIDVEIRRLALLQLGLLYNLMQVTSMQEKDHVIHLLDLLRDQFPAEAPDRAPIRLASYMTLLLAHALRGIFYPSNFIYPITARFLLQRPELDIHDVPLLYNLLYSSSDDWRKERGWMVRFLADGMQTAEDWRLLKRRHTWDLLASLFQGSYNDRNLRHGILEVLANLTSQRQAVTSLILKSALIQWMEMQLVSAKADESVAWAKIVENMIVVVDATKVEVASKGEWRRSLLRCLICLLRDADIKLLRIVTRCVARLVDKGPQNSLVPDETVGLCLERLEAFENSTTIVFPQHRGQEIPSSSEDALPPHRSQGLHHLPFEESLVSWGSVVEHLWRVSMTCSSRADLWNGLTARLLLWRSMCGSEISPVGEWARQQTILMLREGIES